MNKTWSFPQVFVDTALSNQTTGQCDCDCDCACGMNMPSFSGVDFFALDQLSQLRAIQPSYRLMLDDEYSLCYGPQHLPIVLNRSALNLLDTLNSRTKDFLSVEQAALIKLVQAGLVRPPAQINVLQFATSNTLTAWLHVSDRCNLRCKYCYLPHQHNDLTPEIGRASIDAIFRSALKNGYDWIKIKYAGGEPLLCLTEVISLHQYAQSLAQGNNITLDGIILSNGTLLNMSVIESLKQTGLRLMISLDGIDETSNYQRRFENGNETASLVCRKIDLALQAGLKPEISTTITNTNVSGLANLTNWLIDRDLRFSFNFYRENPYSTGLSQLDLCQSEFLSGFIDALNVISARLPRHSLLNSLADRARLSIPHLKTCSVGQNYMVITPDGKIAKCQMDMEHVITDIGMPDPLADIQHDQAGIQNLSVEDKAECHGCTWEYWCCGGCSLAAYRSTGRYTGRSPSCSVYKIIFPLILRLEGLRLLQQAIQ
jgi:uncharacterized protein